MIKSIVLENIGETESFEANFNKKLNIITVKDSDALAFALGRITNNFPLCRAFPTLLRKSSRIYAEIELDREYVFDTDNPLDNSVISSLLSQSREEDEACFYTNGKFRGCKARLAEYKDHEYFFPNKRLMRITNGSCLSRSFRAYLTEYIRAFKPQRLNPKKDFLIDINALGEFFVRRENGGDVFLSASEDALFDFLCFLNIMEFWEGFEEIRDFNYIKKPIIIIDLFERIDESIPKDYIINRLKKINRQIFSIESK